MFPDLLKSVIWSVLTTALLPFSSSPVEFLLRSQEIVFVGARYKHSRVHKGYASTDRPQFGPDSANECKEATSHRLVIQCFS